MGICVPIIWANTWVLANQKSAISPQNNYMLYRTISNALWCLLFHKPINLEQQSFSWLWHFVVSSDCISLISNGRMIRHRFSSSWVICLFLLLTLYIFLYLFKAFSHSYQMIFLYLSIDKNISLLFFFCHIHKANNVLPVMDFNI